MANISVKGKWLVWRNSPAYGADSGVIRMDTIACVTHSDGDDYVSIVTTSGTYTSVHDVTVEEVLSLLGTYTDRSVTDVVARQAARIAELEEQLGIKA